jgi:hypothetical protein
VLEDRTVPASLSYSTFLNATVYATAVDSVGDVYVTGKSLNLPTTPGAFETTGAGAFVAKLNPTGTALIYATYLGNDTSSTHFLGAGSGITVDAAGDVYVIGDNLNVPTTPNALASSPSGFAGNSVFVAELNPTGSGLIYSTYLPGAVSFPAFTLGYSGAIALDGSENIYVAGAAEAGLPVTAGPFQTAYLDGSGGNNAFFAKINPALSGTASVVYATYLGGSGLTGDAASAIALDSAGNAYLEGYTTSTNFPTTNGAFQTTFGVGREDAFVAKINPALSGAASLVYSTYLGGSGWSGYVPSSQTVDNAQVNGGIAVDSAGNAYVTSATTSTNFPTTPGAYQGNSNMPNLNNGLTTQPSDVFVTKLNATGTALIYSTYIGGGISGHGKNTSGTRSGGSSIALDSSGDAEVTGWTNSTVFPTKNALQTTNAGGYDAFVTVLNPSGSGLLFSSYFGGSGNDNGYGIALDSAGNAYVGGGTSSSNFPTTPGAYQTAPGSGFVLKIDPPADLSEVSVLIPAGGTNWAAPDDLRSSKADSWLASSVSTAQMGSSPGNALVFSMISNPNTQVILAPTAAAGFVGVHQNLPGVNGNAATMAGASTIEAACGSSRSQTLFGNAAPGNSVSSIAADAKQSFAEERSQPEFGNEVGSEVRNEGDEEVVPAAPLNEPVL